MTPKDMIRSRFSESASRYDKTAFLQNDVRRSLFEKLSIQDGSSILDVGCGTGALLHEIKGLNPSGLNCGIDVSAGMLMQTNGMRKHCLIADGSDLPFKNGSFDLIVSSSSYQWISDLSGAFTDVRRVLRKGGAFHCAMFSEGTLQELFESLGKGGVKVNDLKKLHSVSKINNDLRAADFRNVSVAVDQKSIVFKDVWSVLSWLKSTGANSLGRTFLGPKALKRAQENYEKRYGVNGGIKATFEIAWIKAEK